MMKISKHAEKRIRKRLGIPRKAVDKFVEEAVSKGTKLKGFKGSIKRYYDAISIQYKAGNNTFCYNDYLFIVQDDVIITVHQIPNQYRGKL